jgi:hypothetical protein
MWLVANPAMLYTGATVLLLSKDILSKVIGVGISGIEYTFSYMTSSNANVYIKKYKDDLEILDIELKLKLIDYWLKQIDIEKVQPDSSQEMIYKGISDSCHKLTDCINEINEKIKYHHTKWFQSWRGLELDTNIKLLEKHVKILDERLLLLNLLK